MNLETAFTWLNAETGPALFREARRLYGVSEYGGTSAAYSNPVIMGWADEVGVRADYTGDLTAWCGLAMSVIAKRSGYAVVPYPLRAKSWQAFGVHADVPAFGDVLIFKRPGGYHVALYVAESATHYYILGGNQANRFCLAAMDKKDFIEARRPAYVIRPYGSRPVIVEGNSLQVVKGARPNPLLLAAGVTAAAGVAVYFLVNPGKIRTP